MTRRRTTFLAGAGVLLSVAGALVIWRGTAGGPAWFTVGGIVVTLAGLVCLRIVFWARRVQAMTHAGIALSHPAGPRERPGGGSPADPPS